MATSTGPSSANPVSSLFNAIYNGLISVLDVFFGGLQKLIGTNNMAYVFVLPNLIVFGLFILVPFVLNFAYAFTGGTEFFLENRPFVGTTNFEQLFQCESFLEPNSCREDLFWRGVFNTAGYVVFQVIWMVAISLLTAIVLNRDIRGRGFFRSVYFYPVLLSPIVVALIWKWILQENGLVNGVLDGWGFDKVRFLTTAGWARFWVIAISVWAYMGFYTLILLAGLQGIPAQLYEAAKIDGANAWQQFRNITMPLLQPTMLVVLVLALIRAVQVFDIVWAFTRGGPGTATLTLVQYIYEIGFRSPARRFGIASAASIVMAGFLVIMTLIQLRVNRGDNE